MPTNKLLLSQTRNVYSAHKSEVIPLTHRRSVKTKLIGTGSRFIHSFIPDIYIAPLQETYSEALSVQLRSKRNVLRSLQKEDTLFRGSKRSVRGSLFQVE